MNKIEKLSLGVAMVSLMLLCGYRSCRALMSQKNEDDATDSMGDKASKLTEMVGAYVQWLQRTS